MSQYDNSETVIAGVMIESNLVEGSQKLQKDCELEYGKSITDACVGLESTTKMLNRMASSWRNKNVVVTNLVDKVSEWNHDDFVNNIRC